VADRVNVTFSTIQSEMVALARPHPTVSMRGLFRPTDGHRRDGIGRRSLSV
jgi:hypothetical protein